MSHVYLIAESGRPKELLEAWRDEYLKGMQAYRSVGRALGATGLKGFPFERPGAFRFPLGAEPEGWTKQRGNNGSRPKRGNVADEARLSAIAFPEHPERMLAEELSLATGYTYKSGSSIGFQSFGGWRAFGACWSVHMDGTLGPVIIQAPDYAEILKRTDLEVACWRPEGAGPGIPEGFRQISEAEVDLQFALDRVAREAYLKADAAMAECLAEDGRRRPHDAIAHVLKEFRVSLDIMFDSGTDGFSITVCETGSAAQAHPSLARAAKAILPSLIRCNSAGWSETTEATGRVIWEAGEAPFLYMTDVDNDCLHETYIDMDLLDDAVTEEPVSAVSTA